MKKRLKKHLLGLAVALLAFAAAGLLTPLVEYHAGRMEARSDLLRGRRQLKDCRRSVCGVEELRVLGLTIAQRAECVEGRQPELDEFKHRFADTLQERFGVVTEWVETCDRRADGYNRRQIEEFDRVHGDGAFSRAGRQQLRDFQQILRDRERE